MIWRILFFAYTRIIKKTSPVVAIFVLLSIFCIPTLVLAKEKESSVLPTTDLVHSTRLEQNIESLDLANREDTVTAVSASRELENGLPVKGKGDGTSSLPPQARQVFGGDEDPLPLSVAATNIENNPGDILEKDEPHTIDVSGAFTYNYPLPLPPSRHNLVPNIVLQYSSHNIDHTSIVGRGWSLSLPSIQRINSTGASAMRDASNTHFMSSIGGELKPLQITSGTAYGTYGQRTETGPLHAYTLNANNTWTIIDPEGTVYTYGANPMDRVSDPQNSGYVYEWMLSEIRDVHDNFVRFEYVRDQGRLYPARVVYTGNGVTEGPTEILFDLEIHPYPTTSAEAGFLVTTARHIDNIRILHDGTLLKKIELTYTQSSNSHISLLQSIQETGYDENANASIQNPLQFNYGDVSPSSWSTATSWQVAPVQFTWGTRYADVNGDSRTDIIQRSSTGSNNNISISKVFLNTGTGFVQSQQWTNTLSALGNDTFYNSGPVTNDKGPRCLFISDLNGDGYADMWKSGTAYLNTGAVTPGWQATPWTSVGSNGECLAYKLADVDGDGLEDLLYNTRKRISTSQIYYYQKVFRNTGSSFVFDQQWTNGLISTLGTNYFYVIRINTATNNYSRNEDVDLVDMNNDGYVDVYDPTAGLYVNSGHASTGWILDPDWTPPSQYYNSYKNIRFADTNGDSMTDMMHESVIFGNSGDNLIQHSYTQGGYFHDGPNAQTFYTFTNNNTDGPNPLAMADLNSDKKTDAIWQGNKVYVNQSQGNDHHVLNHITLPTGGTVAVAYDFSAREMGPGNVYYNNSSSNYHIVKSITLDSGIGAPSVTQYQYHDAYVKVNTPQDKRLAGFGSIDTLHPDGSIIKTYYHQGNDSRTVLGENNDAYSKIGKSYRTEVYNNTQNLYLVTTTKWQETALGNNRYFVYPENKLTMYHDGQAVVSHASAVEYVYDTNYGIIQTEIERGSVIGNNNGTYANNSTSDDRYTETEYAMNPVRHVIQPKRTLTRDTAMNIQSEKKYLFDNLPYGQIDKGLITTESILIDSTVYASTHRAFNTFGLPISTTDPIGSITTTAYDGYDLYPSVITNALGHSVHHYYDYSSGEVKKTIDANNKELKTTFDGVDRPVSQWRVSDNGILEKTAEYTYHAGTIPHYVETTKYLDATNTIVSRTYTDGFGKMVQERSDNIARDVVYDQKGRVHKASLPYPSQGLSYTQPTSQQALITTIQYDPLDRKTIVTDAAGTTTYLYNGLEHTIINKRGIHKDIIYDAFGNVITVKEYIGNNQPYSTAYEYNINNKLVRITDAIGNTRTFGYDYRGLRTAMTDLHRPNDAVFGTYTYTYNARGDLVISTDPSSTTTTTYDVVGRPIQIDNSSTATNPDISYTYDVCTNGIGRMCSASVAGITTEYAYTPQGMHSSVRRTINGVQYIQKTTHNRQGNSTVVTYPNNTQVLYTYNARGLVSSVALDAISGLRGQHAFASLYYAPNNQIASIQYANGVTTTHSYDAQMLYRRLLTKTLAFGGAVLQDIAYTYDNIGNVTGITDQSIGSTSKVASYSYDDLDRLIQTVVTYTGNNQNYLQTYAYDALGNVLSTSDGGTYSYVDQGMNNPHAVTQAGATALVYDSRGNVTSAGSTSYHYQWNNKMDKSIDGSIITMYAYDHEGSRFLRTNNCMNQTSIFCAASTIPDQEITVSPTYLVRDGVPEISIVAQGITLGNLERSTARYTHTDHLNSSSLITDHMGNKLQLLDYYPFGKTRVNEKTTAYDTKHKFTGHQHDEDTGLTYMLARYYDPRLQRFFGQDPIALVSPEKLLQDPQQLNSYSYARNNPLIYVDPTGMFNVKSGLIERGDTLTSITKTINETFKTNYSTKNIQGLNSITNPDFIKAGEVIIPNNIVPDITKSLTEYMHTNAKDPSINKIDGIVSFAQNVKDGGVWDFKNNPNSEFYSASHGDGFVFNGEKVPLDFPANAHYGYVGNSTWWGGKQLLLFAGGVGQTISNISDGKPPVWNTPYFDNVGDSEQITKGIDYYKMGY